MLEPGFDACRLLVEPLRVLHLLSALPLCLGLLLCVLLGLGTPSLLGVLSCLLARGTVGDSARLLFLLARCLGRLLVQQTLCILQAKIG